MFQTLKWNNKTRADSLSRRVLFFGFTHRTTWTCRIWRCFTFQLGPFFLALIGCGKLFYCLGNYIFNWQNRKRPSHENHAALTATAMRVTLQQQVLSFQDGVRSCLHFHIAAMHYLHPMRFWVPGLAGVILFVCLHCVISRKPAMLANNRGELF